MISTISNLTLDPVNAIYDEVIPARQPWSRVVKSGQILGLGELSQ